MNSETQIAKVREALFADADTAPFVDRLHIAAGDPARIEGEVTSIAARRKAARIARRALPSVEVEDGVHLARAIRQSDRELADVLRQALRDEPPLAGVHVLEPGSRPPPLDQPWIGVSAHGGVILLGGWLETLAEKAVAEGLAWETGACSDVQNMICHEPRCAHYDEDTRRAVTTLIREHAGLAGEAIAVDVDHARVRLSGRISTPARRELARSLCWYVPTVRDVRDELTLAPPAQR